MSKFITSNILNAEIEKLFESAAEQLILISPFVKLHPRYESSLEMQVNNPKLKITIVFGKNENDPNRSISPIDLEFFKKFPNIEIRYEKRLHAKYYANESSAIVTSMNLYSYSQDNNIESGVLMEPSFARGITKSIIGTESLDDQAWQYFKRVIEQSVLLYKKIPQFENTFMGLGKKYTQSLIDTDTTESFFKKSKSAGRIQEGPGYCILTGDKIAFNIDRPLSESAYKAWLKKKDLNQKGNYCHYSGEEGETSYSRPILKKNWKKAQEVASSN